VEKSEPCLDNNNRFLDAGDVFLDDDRELDGGDELFLEPTAPRVCLPEGLYEFTIENIYGGGIYYNLTSGGEGIISG